MESMKFIKNIFWNSSQKRLRAAWRLGLQFNLFFAVVIIYAIPTQLAAPGLGASLLGSLLYLFCGIGAALLMARFIDRRRFTDYGFHFNRLWWLDFGFGLLLGAFLLTGIFLTEKSLGWVSLTGRLVSGLPLPFSLAFLLAVLNYLAVGVNEELTFRGYQLKNLAEGLRGKKLGASAAILLALLISSMFFGLGHITNPGASVASTLNIILAGLLLALPFLLTGELAASIGLHITWNLFEGTVYGFAVSGGAPGTHLFAIQQSGPELWTGGAFGPEAGLLCILWILVGGGLVILWVRFLRQRIALHLPLAEYRGNVKGQKMVKRHPGSA